MSFRDDREALLRRIESLEAELRSAGGPVRREALSRLEELGRSVREATEEVDQTRDALAELASRIDQIRTEVGGVAPAPHRRPLWPWIAVTVPIVVTGFLWVRGSGPSPAPERAEPRPPRTRTPAEQAAPQRPEAASEGQRSKRCVPGTIQRAIPRGVECTFEDVSLPAAPDVSPYCHYLADGYMGFSWTLTDQTRDHSCPRGMTRADNPTMGYCVVRGIEAPEGHELWADCDDLRQGRLGYRILERRGPPARRLPLPRRSGTPRAPIAVPRLVGDGEIRCDLDTVIASLGSCSRLDVASVAASGSDPTMGGAAVDGDACTVWNSGSWAPQTVSLDLGSRRSFSALLLVTETTPDGPTTVVLDLSDDGEAFAPAAVIRGEIATQRAYAVTFARPLEARHVRLRSTRSQSWIAWREVAALVCE